MKTLMRWLLGTVTARVTIPQPAEFLNQCTRRGLSLQKMEPLDPVTLRLQVSARNRKALHSLVSAQGGEVTEEATHGLPFFLWGFRRRYALLAGLAAFLILSLLGGQVILTVDVSGNEKLTEEEILSNLRLCGVSQGTWGPSVPVRAVENKMKLAMDDLTHISLNLKGTRAEVIVREKIPAPALKEEDRPTHIVSAADGILTHIEPWRGDAQFVPGDQIRKGDILISGTIRLDYPPNVETIPRQALVHADGIATAETTRVLTAALPLTAPVKAYTGRETSRWSLTLDGERTLFSQNSGIPYPKCDIITQLRSWTPWEGRTLPLICQRETFREYTLREAPIDPAAAEACLKTALLEELTALIGDGEILGKDYQVETDEERLTVTLTARCTEQVGRMVDVDTEARVTAPPHPAKGTYGESQGPREE